MGSSRCLSIFFLAHQGGRKAGPSSVLYRFHIGPASNTGNGFKSARVRLAGGWAAVVGGDLFSAINPTAECLSPDSSGRRAAINAGVVFQPPRKNPDRLAEAPVRSSRSPMRAKKRPPLGK